MKEMSQSQIRKAVEANIIERLAEGDGIWRSCSGCHETEDGQNVHGYPHSDVFGCTLGSGCSECGGIGAVWDTTDYGAMAEELVAKDSCRGGINPGWDECPKCGATSDEDCRSPNRKWRVETRVTSMCLYTVDAENEKDAEAATIHACPEHAEDVNEETISIVEVTA